MKAKDVKVGGTYLTTVSGRKVRVTVTGETSRRPSYGTEREGPIRFNVKRVDNGQQLPKPRTAASLSEAPALYPMYEVRNGDGKLISIGRSGNGPEHVANISKGYYYHVAYSESDLTVDLVRVDDGVHEFKVTHGPYERGVLRVSKVDS